MLLQISLYMLWESRKAYVYLGLTVEPPYNQQFGTEIL